MRFLQVWLAVCAVVLFPAFVQAVHFTTVADPQEIAIGQHCYPMCLPG